MTYYLVILDGLVSCGFASVDVARAVAMVATVETYWAIEVWR